MLTCTSTPGQNKQSWIQALRRVQVHELRYGLAGIPSTLLPGLSAMVGPSEATMASRDVEVWTELGVGLS